MPTSKDDDARALAMQQHIAALQMQQQIVVLQEQQQVHQDTQQQAQKDAEQLVQQQAQQEAQQAAQQALQQEAQNQKQEEAQQQALQEAQQQALQQAQQEAQQEALQEAQQQALQQAQQEVQQQALQEAQQQALQQAQQEAQQQALLQAQQEAQQQALQEAQQQALQEAQQQALQQAQREAQQQAIQQAQQEAQQQALQHAQQEAQQQALQHAQQEAQQLALQEVQQQALQQAQQEALQEAQQQALQEAQQQALQEAQQQAQQEAQQRVLQQVQQHLQQSPSPPQHSPSQQAPMQHLNHQHTQTGSILGDENDNENKKPEGQPSQVVYHSVAVQTQADPEFDTPLYNVITEDGAMAYDDGVRVLRAIGTWGQEYATAAQIQEQNGDNYINDTVNATSLMRNVSHTNSISDTISVVPTSPSGSAADSAAVSIAGSSARPAGLIVQASQAAANKPPTDKAFTCPVCNKGLARKDKLVIHMRIHTGEKPYVCEVCERAFARRDKLVMHMNKLKHLTPTNIAPLGKRQNPVPTPVASPVPDKRQDLKAVEDSINVEIGSPASSIDLQPAALVQVVHDQPSMTWNCELCGRICTSREEWTLHARSHLDGENSFSSTSVSSSLSVLTPLSPYQYSASSPERHICMVCRQEFSSKTDFVLHMRGHFVGKPELLASHVAGLVDSSGMCT